MESNTSEYIIDLIEQERRRLARDIHDGPAQSLTNVLMRLEIIKKLLESNRIDNCVQEVERLQNILRTSVNDIRRLIYDLRPTFLEGGIVQAIRAYSERFSQISAIEAQILGDWSGVALPYSTEVGLFRVFQEILNNIMKHSGATSVRVLLSSTDSVCQLEVQDNGVGFDCNIDVASMTSYGIRGMKERIELIGGTMRVLSKVGEGTSVHCSVPLPHE